MESDLIPYTAAQTISATAALVLAPHADDEVFGCGGAIARHVQAGCPLQVIVLTDGALAGDVALRQKESIEAAAILGYGRPEFWGLPDRALQCTDALIERLVARLKHDQIDLLYAPSPWEVHPDHRQTTQLAVEAMRRSTHPLQLAFYEVGAPLKPNLLLDITTVAAIKDAAMQCFASQLQRQDYARHIRALNTFRTYSLPADVSVAEAYRVVSQRSVLDDAMTVYAKPLPLLAHATETPPTRRSLVSVLVRSMDIPSLAQTLDSLALQDYPNLEVVVIAARPEHRPLPARCGPFALRLIPTTTPLQRSAAANAGLDQARGDYLLFLDDDDWLMPGHISRLASTLDALPASPAAYTGVGLVDAQGAPQGQAFDIPFDAVRLLSGNLTPIHGVMFRASVRERACRFDVQLDQLEDWDFWQQVSRLGPMVHVPGVSAVYRIHASSGVHVDAGPLGKSSQAVYSKWRSSWSDQELGAMMLRVWAFPDLEDRTKQQDQHIRALHAHMAEKDHHIAVQADQLQQSQDRLVQMQADLDAQRITLQERVSELHNLAIELQMIRDAIELMRNSRSWRLTRPLRWLTGLLQRSHTP